MNLEFIFGEDETNFQKNEDSFQLNLKSEVLDKRNKWIILKDIDISETSKNIAFFGNEKFTGGIFIETVDRDLAGKSFKIYNEIFNRSEDFRLCRAWNFIPEINESIEGEEIYKIFNKGRSKAFYEYFENPKSLMPSATGVDILGEKFIIVFIGTKYPVKHFSNPLQKSSFNYPKKYGAMPPSFARATKTKYQNKNLIFISGTASIRGHQTVNKGNILKQTDTTIENINIMLKQTGNYSEIPDEKKFKTEKIIYLKNKKDFKILKEHLLQNHPLFSDGIFLNANMCRKDLEIEISLTAYGQ